MASCMLVLSASFSQNAAVPTASYNPFRHSRDTDSLGTAGNATPETLPGNFRLNLVCRVEASVCTGCTETQNEKPRFSARNPLTTKLPQILGELRDLSGTVASACHLCTREEK